MTDARAISGTYADLKFIKTRSVAQIVMEIPIEHADEFLKMFGAPQPGKEIPVAIARLNDPVAQQQSASKPITAKAAPDGIQEVVGSNPTGVSKSKRAFSELSLPQQAGIRCEDKEFHRFLSISYGSVNNVILDPADFVRVNCGVNSRSELSTNHVAANKWRALESDYQNYITDKNYGAMSR